MTDFVQRLHTAGREVPASGDLLHEAANRTEQLEAEVQEQCRINGMGAERELALIAKVEKLEREIAELREDAERYRAIPKLDWYVGPEYNTYNDVVIDEYANHSVSKQELDAAIDEATK